jgi:NAD(P)-dependent dehydrogenase (short-subunit alcohol dehydrogenase family)
MSKVVSFSNYAGRTVAVTGGTTGIGRMIAEGFAAAGAEVIICARNAAACENVSAEITAKGAGSCVGIPVDLSKFDGIVAFAEAVARRTKALHTLVNCAGTALIAPIDEYPEAGWDNVVDLNLKASFFTVQRLLPLLRRGGNAEWPASVINIGSIAGVKIQQRENYAYAASKAGLHYLTKSLAKHLGPDAITVNAIAPGLFLTELTREHAGAFAEQFIKETPRRRLGEPADIADLACFLASPSAGFLTGVVIPLDGGVSV